MPFPPKRTTRASTAAMRGELRADYPASAAVFDGMAAEEDGHRQRLIEIHRARFGEMIPLIRREHVAGFYARRPVWLAENPDAGADPRRKRTRWSGRPQRFYETAAQASPDAATRRLLGDLAAAEAGHERRADGLEDVHLGADARVVRGRGRAAAVHPDLGAAGAGGVDGRLGVHAGADLRHGLRHAGHLDDVSGRPGGGGGRGHLDGLHRGRA